MKNKRVTALLISVLGIFLLFSGCGESKSETTDMEAVVIEESMSEKTGADISSTQVSELYQSQSLMMEMLVNDSCVIEDTGDTIVISTPDGLASVSVSFMPGIQNLGMAAELIPQVLIASGVYPGEVKEGILFGARANHCTFFAPEEEASAEVIDTAATQETGEVQGAETGGYGIFATSIINSSLYMVSVGFEAGCTDEDAELILNVFSSMNVLKPVTVDVSTKEATYQTKYPEAKPAKATKKTYQPVTEWIYPPYYYYGWYSDFDYSVYPSMFYEPDWDYYLDGAWWSWDWDDSGYWGFYDEYSDWYAESYYNGYDYYYDYDPYSDPGDYYDYYYDYDPYSDPGDYYDDYDPYSDPGDYYDDYDPYSDPGDYYDDYDYYSDPGDYYDDYDYSYDDYSYDSYDDYSYDSYDDYGDW